MFRDTNTPAEAGGKNVSTIHRGTKVQSPSPTHTAPGTGSATAPVRHGAVTPTPPVTSYTPPPPPTPVEPYKTRSDTTAAVNLLLEILSNRRPHDDAWEKRFVEEYIIKFLKGQGLTVLEMGPMKNLAVIVKGGNTRTLFSCHTDTVHRTGGWQEVLFDPEMGQAYKNDKECLGADDGTGVWLMMEMIRRKVPGTYVFHRGEERGCIGSKWMASTQQSYLRNYDYAIAFDRKNTENVITHQRGLRCCSDEFAKALSAQLNLHGGESFKFAPDSTGAYTDTASYTEYIAECTNLSVGYEGAHGGGETQDVDFAVALLEALCKVEWGKLPVKRTPKKETYEYSGSRGYNGYHGGYGGYGDGPATRDEWDMFDRARGQPTPPYDKGSNSGYGYSSSAYPMASRSLLQAEDSLRNRFVFGAGQRALLKYAAKITESPPVTLHQMVTEAPYYDIDDYLMALVRLHPERAVLALRSALTYYQHYAVNLRMEDGRMEPGVLLLPPLRTEHLKFEHGFGYGAHGFLNISPGKDPFAEIDKAVAKKNQPKRAAPATEEEKTAVAAILLERERRKALKKERKAAKKQRRALDANFPGRRTPAQAKPAVKTAEAAPSAPTITPLIKQTDFPPQVGQTEPDPSFGEGNFDPYEVY